MAPILDHFPWKDKTKHGSALYWFDTSTIVSSYLWKHSWIWWLMLYFIWSFSSFQGRNSFICWEKCSHIDFGYYCGTCSALVLPEGGVVLGWQKCLDRFHPGAANMCVIGHLTGNTQQPRGTWEVGVRQSLCHNGSIWTKFCLFVLFQKKTSPCSGVSIVNHKFRVSLYTSMENSHSLERKPT